ncbi:MAG: thiamine pyrophosphate-dependent enzyme, partial [Planctomycetota bacterium]
VDWCRESVRPAFIELRTYRYKGHSMSDPRKYRTKEEEQQFEMEDPIERLARFLMTERDLGREEYEALVKEVRKQVREAIKWAEASPRPGLEELYADVYADAWGPYPGRGPAPMSDEGSDEATERRSDEGETPPVANPYG